ncbi:DUF4893 domain-containing protein [Sphingomonas alpina]|uniref:DUF4893 domain-containing protein n=1 Tax=Sphingomonas alpina TaxID=653931 RepID=A0A7H0LPV2_9SPHN|nr:DUF4893 domain-containing protein [Sphingomonas alpina]QNQ11705.1 DUF4893 domain-containing protein [Sphingomonas alpina]
MKRFGFALAACGALMACGGKGASPATASTPAALDWRQVATKGDRIRLRNWRDAWMTALAKAQASGNGQAIAAEGVLFDPDRALSNALPPAGSYRCRVFKLGANGTAAHDFIAYPWFGCRVDAEGEVSSFYKSNGSQRPVGLAFPDGDMRGVFLGTMVFGDETTALDYGRDADRDMAGIIDRVDDKRWRIALPYPKFESILDVVEIVPAS